MKIDRQEATDWGRKKKKIFAKPIVTANSTFDLKQIEDLYFVQPRRRQQTTSWCPGDSHHCKNIGVRPKSRVYISLCAILLINSMENGVKMVKKRGKNTEEQEKIGFCFAWFCRCCSFERREKGPRANSTFGQFSRSSLKYIAPDFHLEPATPPFFPHSLRATLTIIRGLCWQRPIMFERA